MASFSVAMSRTETTLAVIRSAAVFALRFSVNQPLPYTFSAMTHLLSDQRSGERCTNTGPATDAGDRGRRKHSAGLIKSSKPGTGKTKGPEKPCSPGNLSAEPTGGD